MAPRNHAACVASYCDAPLSGEIIAGRYVQLAVRHSHPIAQAGHLPVEWDYWEAYDKRLLAICSTC